MAIDFTELLKISREAQRIDRERAELFGPMIGGPAWGEYVKLLNLRLQAFSDQLLVPGAEHTEFIKGAMFSILLCRDLPGVIVASLATDTQEDEDGSE